MTGAYLLGKDKDGKRVPIEIEHLTEEERKASLGGRTSDELMSWIELLCKELRETENWLKEIGYIKDEDDTTV